MPYIDRDWLVKQAKTDGAYDYVSLHEILNAPTADVAPVRHGEWIEAKYGEMSLYPDGQKMCDLCKTIMPSTWKSMPPYCFNCGALME